MWTVQDAGAVERAHRQEAVGRVGSSHTFKNHPTLRQLLHYLAARAEDAGAEELKEYVIGVEAFSKPGSYDPQKDASVRVQVSRLRKCLADYYREECPGDPVRIDIPKGQFRMEFRPNCDGAREAAAHPMTPVHAPLPDGLLARRLRIMKRACVGLSILAAVTTAALVVSWTVPGMREPRAVLSPDLTAVWGAYLRGSRPVLVVMGAPLFAKYTTRDTGVFFRDPRLNEWEEAVSSPAVASIGNALDAGPVTPSRIYTGVGEATGAFLLSRLFSQSKQEILLRRSHALSLDDFKDRNVIVLGAPKHNAHLNHLPVEQHFTFIRGSIRNVRPRDGEPAMFEPRFAAGFEELEEDHALISRFPGLHGIGETTVLAGASTEATLAAVEFATQPRYAAELTARLRGENGEMPGAFQVVVRAKFKSQTPVEIRYVSHRLLDAKKLDTRQQKAAAVNLSGER